ncbi:hypothetical protein M409DRAFT_70385 [Zasmidium cellare ATCC 36951]|uniref:Glycosyl transferase CAP10 domain-containing protein n=1 Tax=Zasmidium cellare ATCC 36951 TaxID=1080233 RepID=A0A6A6C2C1_ZASCE|nr:uncharacterized protein M409DRAFT_70385 [Zasmidium cellare ATCC 36951]KAF2160418.1 hypothetical protein M409DRAFT_70385 [Zasmidium cellare ATCC 36951]
MDSVISWKRLCLFLIALLCFQSTLNFLGKSDYEVLFAAECTANFPDLYYEIDRAVKYWHDRKHTITAEDVDISWRNDAAVRILIHENELRILETKGTFDNQGYRMRTLSVLSMLQEALLSASAGGERLPTIEAAIVVDDMSLLSGGPDDTRSIWTFTSNIHDESHRRHWLIPDFSMYSARGTGSWRDMRRRAMEFDAPFSEKLPRVVWRGVRWTNEGVRGSLLDETEGEDWADVKVVDWETRENMMAQDEMCRYAFTVHTEGRSYSGRLPFLLNCNSLPLIHDLDWTTHFYHLLISSGKNQNYVPVKRSFIDLPKTLHRYLAHPDEAQRIINNSVATFREKYTSPAATSCYFRRLIGGWGKVSFEPGVLRNGSEVRRRGVSFEEFVHVEGDYRGG